jgi:hypothetical protein
MEVGMAYSDKYELGDRVWYETEDGNRYLMVIKELGSSSLALYPLRDTRLMLKDTSESTYNYIGFDKVSPATAATDKNLFLGRQVAEAAIKRAVNSTEQKGYSLSSEQKNLMSQAIVQGFLEMREKIDPLERHGLL